MFPTHNAHYPFGGFVLSSVEDSMFLLKNIHPHDSPHIQR
jgi:hypothetical protein